MVKTEKKTVPVVVSGIIDGEGIEIDDHGWYVVKERKKNLNHPLIF